MYPPIEPFKTGHLAVGDGNEIYWETSGNLQGLPALYLHGGPGGGILGGYRRRFDPEKFLIISFEQRGCGRSRPLATDPGADLSKNTTQMLIEDIERLRKHLGIDAWLVHGVSWGTTLALAYAQAHPLRVTGLILAAVTTTTTHEVDWITEKIRAVFPREWEEFREAAQPEPGERLIEAYHRRITSADPDEREAAARAWCAWEDVHVSLSPGHAPNPRYQDPDYRLLFATLVIHYWRNAAFLNDRLLSQMSCLADIPGVLIHGRFDVSSPLETAWRLHKAWPGSRLIVTDDGHGGPGMAAEVTKAADGFACGVG